MQTGFAVLAALIVLGVLLAILIPMGAGAAEAAAEGFELSPQSQDRADYIRTGQDRYNRFSETADVTRKSAFVGLTDAERVERNRDLAAATNTSTLFNDGVSGTRVGVRGTSARLRTAPSSQVLGLATKCESLKGRAATCGAVGKGEYANCGVCIKGGTPYTDPDAAGTFIGGMLLLPEDREVAEESAASNGTAPVYAPSIGDCPGGQFVLGGEDCTKAANRADCDEVGASGGFNGKTAEGAAVGEAKCATIAASPSTFIYDPKNRKFDVFLRVLTPAGSGIGRVEVRRGTTRLASVSARENDGTLLVRIPETKEGETLRVTVVQEVPFRAPVAGKEEVFLYAANPAGTAGGYNMTQSVAASTCARIGAAQATLAELEEAQSVGGAQACGTGWTTDAANAVWPMQQAGVAGCGAMGINRWSSTNPANPAEKLGHAWCKGVKPPQSTNPSFFTKVYEWATGYGDAAAAGRPTTKFSRFSTVNDDGTVDEFQTPYYRGIVAQLESGDFTQIVPVDKFLTDVNGVLKTPAGDIKTLRRFGTFAASKLIQSPKPATLPAGSNVQPGAFWFWSNQADSQTLNFSFVVPGTFLPPVYPEDRARIGTSPLITKPATLSLYGAEPCDGGLTTSACLRNLFVAAGGDIYGGDLAKGDFAGLRAWIGSAKTRDEVEGFLADLYSQATRGRDLNGTRIGVTAINAASKNLFGFEIVSPCEDIREDARGNILLVPKAGPYDADCLDWLWKNTGNDRDRGNSDLMRRTRIQNTYTTIGTRFSGLRSTEGSPADRAAAPFRTCTTDGTLAPKTAAGAKNNVAIKAANAKGSIESIQDFYDSVHKTANYKGGSAETATAHATALQQCYGIARSGPVASTAPAAPCGVVARYVRVLASTIQPFNGDVAIQIPQLEVFDMEGREVAKGKTASASSTWNLTSSPMLAVDGQNRPQSFGEGIFHSSGKTARREFWMVDLGSNVEIGRIIFYPRTDCCFNRQLAAPVQLLNNSMRIVAEKLIGSTNYPAGRWSAAIPESLSFSAVDARRFNLYSIGNNTRVSLLSATSFDRYARHAGFQMFASGPDGGDRQTYSGLMKNDASFIARMIDSGSSICRLESTNFPNNFIKIRGTDARAILAPGGDATATMQIVEAVNGDPTMISVRTSGGLYFATSPSDPAVLFFTTIDGTDPWDLQRASWTARIPSLAG